MTDSSSFHKGVKEVQPPTGVLRETYKRMVAWSLIGAGVALVAFAAALALRARAGMGLSFLLPLAAVAMVAFALVNLRDALRLRAPFVIPSRCPPALPHLHDVSSALQEGMLPVYDQAPDLMRRVRRLLGGRLGWGTRASQATAQKVLASVGPLATAILALTAAGLAGFAAGTPQGILGLLAALGGSTVLALWAYRTYREVEHLFPAEDPSTATLERMDTVRGGGDPFVLRSEIEQQMMALRVQGLPNRVLAEGWTVPVETLQNAGRVSGDLVIETHPEHERVEAEPSAARFGDLALVPMQAATLAPLLLLPALGIGANLVGGVLFVAALAACRASIGYGATVANRFRWRSTLLYVHLEGSVGRSEIRAGRGHSDSFESTNTVVRSDCQVRVYAATLLSENLAVDGPRDLVALTQQGNAREAMEAAVGAIRSFESSGVRIRAIDLQDSGLEQTARANLAMEAERRRVTRAVENEALPTGGLSGGPADLPGTPGFGGPLLGFSDARVAPGADGKGSGADAPPGQEAGPAAANAAQDAARSAEE